MALMDFFEAFKRRTLTETDSTLGGKVSTWVDGATFQAGVSTNNNHEARIAYRNGAVTEYIIVVPDGTVLRKDERIKRVGDSVEYRITSDSAVMHTPATASLKYAQSTAEVIT